jgi:hypothetical protein
MVILIEPYSFQSTYVPYVRAPYVPSVIVLGKSLILRNFPDPIPTSDWIRPNPDPVQIRIRSLSDSYFVVRDLVIK